MPATAPPRLRHIPELDGIRGIAALAVLCHHLFYTSIPYPERWNSFVLLASNLSQAGGYGVDLFFVLSGFLITSLLVLDRSSPHFYWNFYWKRALRILPLYLIALILLVAILPATWRYALLSLLFLANFAQLFHIAATGPFWTLAIEEQFYLLWPSFARRLTLARLERLALILVVACPVLRLIAAASHHYNYIFTFFHCDGLALGAILACQQLRKASSPEPPAPATWKPFATLAAALFLTALPFVIPPGTSPAHLAGALQLSGINLLCYCVISAAIRHTGAPLLAIFRSRLFTFFGLISYCLYIANSYVVNSYDAFHGPIAIGNMPHYWVRAAIVTAATLAISLIARYAIELPAMSLRRYVLRRP